jgi:UDPglucose 6-dehydrogenase
MKVTIYGAGYVGLVTGACLASGAHDVVCVDTDPERVAQLNAGVMPIYEPGLAPLVHEARTRGLLRFTSDMHEAVEHGDVQFIAVGTPQDADGSADLRHVFEVARTIGRLMRRPVIVVDKSTVPVGTCERVEAIIGAELAARALELDVQVCSNPEFLKEGSAIADFLDAPRIVIGTASEHVRETMRTLYAPFDSAGGRLIQMDRRAAELTKYAANAMLALRISFINEIATLSERLGIDVDQVRDGIGSDPRIGYAFLSPGCGYGGSCLPKDVAALAHTAAEAGRPSRLLAAVQAINDEQKDAQFDKLERALGSVAGRTIAVWGLAFKPGTDDLRSAPSRTLIESIWRAGGMVRAYDPKAQDEFARLYGRRPDLTLCPSALAAATGAEALVICTDWEEFRGADLGAQRAALARGIVVDGRNLLDPAAAAAAGLDYYGVGRGLSLGAPGVAAAALPEPLRFERRRASRALSGASR